jgi:Secretion system C-terminal sorting domain/FG-GAP-like repeat
VKFSLTFLGFLFSQMSFGQFGEGSELSLGPSNPETILVEDMDGDLDLDVLVISKFGNNVGWYENTGGDFSKLNVISNLAHNATMACMEDFDGDGDKDLIVTCDIILNFPEAIFYFENFGSGEYGPQQVVATTLQQIHEVISMDYDGDSDMDILIVKQNAYFWLENDGNANFGAAQVIPDVNGNYFAIAAGDVDGDSDDDLIVGRSSPDKLFKLENLGGGVYSAGVSITTMVDGIRSIVLKDIDNDSDLDILTASYYDDNIYWYENIGGNFISGGLIATLNGPVKADGGDFDGDGDLDIVAVSFLSDKVVKYENLGGGLFGPEEVLSQFYDQAIDLVVADLDGDLDLDVVTASSYQNKIACHINDGSGILSIQQLISDTLMHSNWPEEVFPTDLDNDGDKDVLFASFSDGSILWIENIGGGQFDSLHNVITDTLDEPISVFACDLDGDSDLDVISASRTQDIVVWFENIGLGNFGPYQIISSLANNPTKVHAADLDNDGDNDVLSTSYIDDKISWYENLGGNFSSQNVLSINSNGPVDIKVADLNNDSLLDVIVSSVNDDKLVWFENFGSGIFGAEQLIDNQIEYPAGIVSADADLDGDYDVFVCYSATSSSVVVLYENLGGGIFNSASALPGFVFEANNLFASDLNNDGYIDIAVTSNIDNQLLWYENLGANIFAPAVLVYEYADGVTSVSAADFDQDGDNDLICSSYEDDKLIWFENYIMNNFQAMGKIFVDFTENGVLDSIDIGMNFEQIIASPVQTFSYTYGDGDFNIILDGIGTHQIFPQNISNWHLTTDSLLYNVLIDSNYVIVDSLLFGFFPDTVLDNLNCQIVGSNSPCGQLRTLWGSVQNVGTSIPSGSIEMELDQSLTYNSTMYSVPDSVVGQIVYWSFDSLYYYHDIIKEIQVQMPGVSGIGDTLISTFKVDLKDSLGNIVYTNIDTLSHIVTCAFDPNDKLVDPVGQDSLGYIPLNTQKLDYTIRFQNTGTDTAQSVLIKDQLNQYLDWSSLQILASSYSVQVNIDQFGMVDFLFQNIMLPDSNVNETGSHGFVKFSIELLPGLSGGTSIYNYSSIYFDQNPAIETNTTVNTLECVSILMDELDNDTICDYTSPNSLTATPIGGIFYGNGVSGDVFDPSQAGSGNHTLFYSYNNGNGCSGIDSIEVYVNTCLGLEEDAFPNLTIYPNPFTDFTTVSFGQDLNGEYNIIIYDALGQEVMYKNQITGNQIQIDRKKLNSGVYIFTLVRTTDQKEVKNLKLVVE